MTQPRAPSIWSPSHLLRVLRRVPKLHSMRLDHGQSECVMPSGICGFACICEVRWQAPVGSKSTEPFLDWKPLVFLARLCIFTCLFIDSRDISSYLCHLPPVRPLQLCCPDSIGSLGWRRIGSRLWRSNPSCLSETMKRGNNVWLRQLCLKLSKWGSNSSEKSLLTDDYLRSNLTQRVLPSSQPLPSISTRPQCDTARCQHQRGGGKLYLSSVSSPCSTFLACLVFVFCCCFFFLVRFHNCFYLSPWVKRTFRCYYMLN